MPTTQQILATLPSDTTRVQVQNTMGKTKYKSPSEVLPSDTIQFNSAGDPIVMTSLPGRRPQAAPQAINTATAAVVQHKEDSMKKDPLLRSVTDDPHSLEVLDGIITGISEEAASLHFERQEADRRGNETSKISLRRVNALKAAADVYLKRREQLSSGVVDLDGPAFEKVFLFIIETIRNSMTESGVPYEQVDALFSKVAKQFDAGWQAEARVRMAQK